MESEDYKVLNDPQEFIISNGGSIILVAENDEIVGVCALVFYKDKSYQMAKMAVKEKMRGKGIGNILMNEAIYRFREMGGEKLFLYSNTILIPAIALYKKSGFIEKPLLNAVHKRSNIFMEFCG